MEASSRRRVTFELQPDEGGNPPVASETLWATHLGGDAYELDNIPFFAIGVSLGDVVEAPEADGLPTFVRVLRRGGHATLRVATEEAAIADIRAALVELGASTELSHLPSLVSVDVPPTAPLDAILALLADRAADGNLDWEEADVPA
ncbi:MAG: DUF4265 domain-containing protein [Chloroflexota bacterium]